MRWVCSLVFLVGCGSDAATDEPLQDACVRENVPTPRSQADGTACTNVSSAGCGGLASACLGVCAHGACRSATCTSDASCAGVAAGATCEDFVVDGRSFGRYCRVPERTPAPGGGACDGCGGAFCSGRCVGCPQC